MFDETDEEEWCNYYYSLADYMWKHGIWPTRYEIKSFIWLILILDWNFGKKPVLKH
jgi:hypothetical protein